MPASTLALLIIGLIMVALTAATYGVMVLLNYFKNKKFDYYWNVNTTSTATPQTFTYTFTKEDNVFYEQVKSEAEVEKQKSILELTTVKPKSKKKSRKKTSKKK